MSAPLLELSGVEAGYGDITILRGATLRVDPGSTVIVLGPNGHGKTTLARTISGLIQATAGTIAFGGERIDACSSDEILRRGIVQVPQGDLLFGEMSVLDNLLAATTFTAGAWHGRRERLGEVLDLFPKLAERRKQPASTLSGGERRMLAIGRGLMVPSSLLIIDEPALGLAPLIVEEVYTRIAGLSESGRAILLIEESAGHLSLADTVYVLQNGRIAAEHRGDAALADERLVETYFLGS
jgi:branched-chain amino acid transport system ATP-binding protein